MKKLKDTKEKITNLLNNPRKKYTLDFLKNVMYVFNDLVNLGYSINFRKEVADYYGKLGFNVERYDVNYKIVFNEVKEKRWKKWKKLLYTNY